MSRAVKWISYFDKICYLIEAFIAVVLLATLILNLTDILIGHWLEIPQALIVDFEQQLSTMFTLVIGVEFIKMLCKHSPEAIIEILLFSMARQLILSHATPSETLVGVIAIAVLFSVKKFLLTKSCPNLKTAFKFRKNKD